jgi:DHA1 family bicyclomycin/chloramphenicol resistance-like MFS transporter
MTEALAHRQMQLSILTQTLIFTALFGVLSSIQQVFDMTYGRGDSFPLWFALIALLAAPSGPVNGMLVMRLGMRPMIRRALWLSSAAALGTGVFLLAVPRARASPSISSGPSPSSLPPPSPSAT